MRKHFYTFASNVIARSFETPPYIILFASDKCPNRCRHCWYNSEWKSENITGNALTNDELIRISEGIKTVRFLSITGGEAFLREGIEEIAQAFAANTKVSRLDIPTSGFDPELITKKVEKILKNINGIPFRVDISLDGPEEVHNTIRQNTDAYRNALATLEELKKIRERVKNFDVSIITTISDYNCREIGRFSELVSQILPDGEWMVNIVRGQTPGVVASEEAMAAYREANGIIDRRIAANQFSGDRGHGLGKWLTAKNSLRRDLINEIAANRRRGGACAAGSLAGVIFNDGDVRLCETLPLSFGNIRDYDYSLKDAWNSDKARAARKMIQDTQCICTHECFLSVSVLWQPSCWFRLLGKRMAL